MNAFCHATPYSRYMFSQKRLIHFLYVSLMSSDKQCIQRFSPHFPVKNQPKANKRKIQQKFREIPNYPKSLNAIFIRPNQGIVLDLFQNCLRKSLVGISPQRWCWQKPLIWKVNLEIHCATDTVPCLILNFRLIAKLNEGGRICDCTVSSSFQLRGDMISISLNGIWQIFAFSPIIQ